jgi:hypothetical protein
MTYQDCMPLVHQLNHADKLRLVQWLLTQIALEEGIENIHQAANETGLCGIWQDNRNSAEIIEEILIHRSPSRDIVL